MLRNKHKHVDEFIEHLANVFDLQDLGEARQVLNMTIMRDHECRIIHLRQYLHIIKLLKAYH